MTKHSAAIKDVVVERAKQVERWGNEHDDAHVDGELARAGACYAWGTPHLAGAPWPWPDHEWRPELTYRANLVKAAALIIAEIERLDRAALEAQT